MVCCFDGIKRIPHQNIGWVLYLFGILFAILDPLILNCVNRNPCLKPKNDKNGKFKVMENKFSLPHFLLVLGECYGFDY